jgi:hypothetical protein
VAATMGAPNLRIPTFDASTDPLQWLHHCNECFEAWGTAEEDKIWIATLKLKGTAYQWYRKIERNVGAPTGVFGKVARGLGCAPGSPVSCLAPFSPPPAWPARGKTTPPPGSSRTPFSTVARGLGSAQRWVGDFGALCAGGRWPWRARAGEGKVPPSLLRREIHGL